ncbi:glycosyltransferase family protein [Flammeovirga aprica]|nr:hypothetical protein [Flammeovirga aprica]
MENNILVIVLTLSNGVGGHYYSISALMNSSIKKKYNFSIVNIGINDSKILKDINCSSYDYLKIEKINDTLELLKEIKKIVRRQKIDIIHCFNEQIYWLSVMSGVRRNILTKCGGQNVKHFPKVENLILFSNENLSYYKKLSSSQNYFLIPNRVLPFQNDNKRIERLKSLIGYQKEDIILLKIARITKFYKKSINESIKITNSLNENNIKAKLILIGSEVDSDIIDTSLLQNNVHFIFSDDEFTHNAKEIIDICDIYIGTGRGIMEASSKNKIILGSTSESNLPVLVNEDTLPTFMEYNFSERVPIKIEEEAISKQIISALFDKKNNSKVWFDKYFDIEKVVDVYDNIYSNLVPTINKFNIKLLKNFLHFIYQINKCI